MNIKLVDWWTVIHVISMFIISAMLLLTGAEIISIFITVIFIAVIYEVLEHMFLFTIVKERKEILANSTLDVIFGLLGMILAIIILS